MTKRLLLLLVLLLHPAPAAAQTTWGFTELDLLPLAGVTAPVRFFDLSGHAFTIQAPTAVTSYACTWPGAIGSANQTLSISTVSPCALAWTSSGAGNVTHTGTLTANAFALGNGGADIITASPITGLVLGNGASAPTAYAGTIACSAGDFIKSLNGSGVATCATPAGSGTVTTTGSPANGNLTQFSGATSITNGDLSGDISTSGTLVTTIGANKVTLAKLATQANNTILANISGGAAVPAADTLTAIIDSAIGSAQGDILYRNATVWTVLAPGTSGQFLQTQGAGANVQWSAAGGGTVTGSGTTNLLAIWTSASAIGAFSSGTGLLHAGTPPTWSLVNLSAGGDVVNVLTVPNGGLGISSGTTGGIPYFTTGVSIASSAALTNHAVVIGGGSAQAPHTIATGTTGQFLESQGAGSDPIWATLSAQAIQTSTFVGLPAAGTTGAVRYVTTSGLGLYFDTGASPGGDGEPARWYDTNRPCNVQAWGAVSDGVTNDAAAVEAAITAGCGTVFLPHNTLWKPTGDTIATAIQVLGEDATSKIQSSNPAVTCITVQPNTTFRNVSYQDRCTGFTVTNFLPLVRQDNGVAGPIFAGVSNSNNQIHMEIGPSGADHGGVAVNQRGGGDAYYAQLLDTGGAVNGATGVRVDVRTNNNFSAAYYAFHDTTSWSGEVYRADMQNGSGSFTGSFLAFRNNGVLQFNVDSVGDVNYLGGMAAGSPAGGNLGTGNTNISGGYFVNGVGNSSGSLLYSGGTLRLTSRGTSSAINGAFTLLSTTGSNANPITPLTVDAFGHALFTETVAAPSNANVAWQQNVTATGQRGSVTSNPFDTTAAAPYHYINITDSSTVQGSGVAFPIGLLVQYTTATTFTGPNAGGTQLAISGRVNVHGIDVEEPAGVTGATFLYSDATFSAIPNSYAYGLSAFTDAMPGSSTNWVPFGAIIEMHNEVANLNAHGAWLLNQGSTTAGAALLISTKVNIFSTGGTDAWTDAIRVGPHDGFDSNASVFKVSNAGVVTAAPLAGSGNASVCVNASGQFFRGSPGC